MNNGKSSGWILVGLVLVVVVGNVSLLNGESANLMNVIAVFADVALICLIIYFIFKNVAQKLNEKKNKRKDMVTKQVKALIEKYRPNDVLFFSESSVAIGSVELINREVSSFIRNFINKLKNDIEKADDINSRIGKILICSGFSTMDEKLSYLLENEESLEALKKERDLVYKEIQKHKIQLLNQNKDLLFKVKSAFAKVRNSRKCVSTDISINDLITTRTPSALSLFQYDTAPVILDFKENIFCLFSNVIIVFNRNEGFVTALDPTALKISIKKEQKDILITNNSPISDAYVADDSKCIAKGDLRTTWQYTCRDGSPDLRYSYNPRIEYRTETYEYGTISISILNHSVKYTVSSQEALQSMEAMAADYSVNYSDRHDAVPNLLSLIEKLEDDPVIITMAQSMIEAHRAHHAKDNYFCAEVAI